jgi:hydrogenase maturation protease
MTMKTLVIGLGNPILTDDGVGIYTARAVRRLLPADAPVDVAELAVGGLGLMEAMVGYERAILVDALWSPPDETGEVLQFDAGRLPETLNSASSHDVDLPTALRIGRELGAPLPADDQIQIVAIRANDVLEFGDEPTPPVRAAIPEAVAAVLNLLGCAPAEGLLENLNSALPTLIGGFDDLP